MARPLAADHDDKRRAILKASARVFARHGFDRASTQEIAGEAGVSKALLYHYYSNKEELLVAIIREHLEELVTAISAADDMRLAPRARLRALIVALLECYRDADEEHTIQINELKKLPAAKASELLELERTLVRRFSAALVVAVPALKERQEMIRPVTMNLFGMLNWHYLWFREDGPVSREAYADLVTDMVLGGAGTALGAGTGTPKMRPL